MSETAVCRVRWIGAWLLLLSLLILIYFETYFATVMISDKLIRIRSGSILTDKRRRPEPDFSLRYMAGPALPIGFWRTLFAPAWRVDRAIRPEVWRVSPGNL